MLTPQVKNKNNRISPHDHQALQEWAHTLSSLLDQTSQLRQIENLTEANYQGFLDKKVDSIHMQNRALYFPCATSVSAQSQAQAKFVRQC